MAKTGGMIDFSGLGASAPPPLVYYPGRVTGAWIEQMIDPWTGTPMSLPQTKYQIAAIGLRCCGRPYFALVQDNLAESTGIGGGETRLMVTASIHELPTMLASLDEIHYLFSVHEPIAGGAELFSIGITPSGRLAARTKNRGSLLTPIGVVVPGATPRLFALQGYAGCAVRELSIDGEVIVQHELAGASEGPFAGAVRYMAFNGIDGIARTVATIHSVEFSTENQSPGWLFNERNGGTIKDYEYASDGAGGPFEWRDRSTMTPSPGPGSSDYTGDWDLAARWYDPSQLGFPLVWGTVPVSDPASCYSWERKTAYTPRRAISVPYTPIPKPASSYEPIGLPE